MDKGKGNDLDGVLAAIWESRVAAKVHASFKESASFKEKA